MPDEHPAPQYLIMARVMRPHGVRGDLRVQVVTRFPERMKELDKIYLTRTPEATNVAETASVQRVTWAAPDKSDYWLLHLQGVDDRDAADKFRSCFLLVALENAVPLEEDEVYLFQVMGLEVHTTDGRTLGNVVDVIETGANDVYVIKGETYGEVLIPAIDSVINKIDVANGTMLVNLPDGLLPD